VIVRDGALKVSAHDLGRWVQIELSNGAKIDLKETDEGDLRLYVDGQLELKPMAANAVVIRVEV